MRNFMLTYMNNFKKLYYGLFAPLAERYGLSQLEIDILLFLHNNPEYNTARDIVSLRGFAKSNVSNSVESLRKKGCLYSEQDEKSRRMQRLFISSNAKDMVLELADCQMHCFKIVMKGSSQSEINIIKDFFIRADENISSELKNLNI